MPHNIWSGPQTSLLIGWINNVENNIVVASFAINPIEITSDDRARNQLLDKVKSVNMISDKDKDYAFCIIGSTNVAEHDCSDMMRIYGINYWLQCDKYFRLIKIVSTNKQDINDYYVIKYYAIHRLDTFSAYYTNSGSDDASFNEILKLCNESHHIHLYLHQCGEQGVNGSLFGSFLLYLLCKYFQIIKLVYALFHALIIYLPPLFILSDCRITNELMLNKQKFSQIIKYLEKDNKQKQWRDRCFVYDGFKCIDIDKQRREILDIWSNIMQHFINIILGMMFGYFIYFYMDELLQYASKYLKFFDYDSIKCDMSWLMDRPIGLKLNANLSNVFGKLSLLCLEIVHVQVPHALNLAQYFNLEQSKQIKYDDFLTIWDVFDDNKSKVQCNENVNKYCYYYVITIDQDVFNHFIKLLWNYFDDGSDIRYYLIFIITICYVTSVLSQMLSIGG